MAKSSRSRQQRKAHLFAYEQLGAVQKKVKDDPAFAAMVSLHCCRMGAASGLTFKAFCDLLRPLFEDAEQGIEEMRRGPEVAKELWAEHDKVVAAEAERRRREEEDSDG